MLGRTNAGAELILHDVLGQFVTKVRLYCGGAGITPFISIFVTCIIKLIEGNSLITVQQKTSKMSLWKMNYRKCLKTASSNCSLVLGLEATN
jgi:Trk-type K+ transport system membrane component